MTPGAEPYPIFCYFYHYNHHYHHHHHYNHHHPHHWCPLTWANLWPSYCLRPEVTCACLLQWWVFGETTQCPPALCKWRSTASHTLRGCEVWGSFTQGATSVLTTLWCCLVSWGSGLPAHRAAKSRTTRGCRPKSSPLFSEEVSWVQALTMALLGCIKGHALTEWLSLENTEDFVGSWLIILEIWVKLSMVKAIFYET